MSEKFSAFRSPWLRGLVGCLILYVTFLFLPMLRGEGYGMINHLVKGGGKELLILNGSPIDILLKNDAIFIALIAVLILLKCTISAVGIESGGDGGIFAPSMFTGAMLGYFMARFCNETGLAGSASLPECNFIAVGMGGVLAGVMHAPMTGIFLIAEITGGYKLFIPLMIVTSISCLVCRFFSPYNVYKSMIAQRGGIPESSRETEAMDSALLRDVVEHNYITVRQDDTLRTLLMAIMKSKRNIFPVLDDERHLVGIVSLDSVRKFLLDESLYDVVLVFDIMTGTGPSLDIGDTLGDAANLFETLKIWNIPVLENGKYAGFVSKAGVFDRYRNVLKNKTELF